MSMYKKTFSSCVVLASSLLIISCDQSTGTPSAGSDANQSAPTITTNKSAPTVALSNSDINVFNGDTFTLDLTASNFAASEGGGVSLSFDASLLQVTGVTVDNTVWNFKNKDGRINNAEGTVSDILFSSYQGVVGDAKIATVAFQSTGTGASTITMRESSANPFASNGQNMVVTYKTTSVYSK